MENSNSSPFAAFDAMRFDNTQCFLCGEELDNGEDTKEHVIPKWLLHKFDLWDKTLVLLNRTRISYRYLT